MPLGTEKVFEMKVEELRKELKKKRLSTAGKKSILQFRLIEYIETSKAEQVEETIEEGNEEEQMDTEEPDAHNGTFTVEDADQTIDRPTHDATPTNPVKIVLDDEVKARMAEEYGVDLTNFEVKSRVRTHRTSTRKSLRTTGPEELDENAENREERATPTRATKTPSKSIGDRFAKAHAKEMEKMETLGEHRDRVLKRHQELTENVPESIKRLATPKSAKVSRRRSWKPENPENMTFKFGETDVDSFKAVASVKKDVVEKNETPGLKKKAATAHRDVKSLTRPTGIPRPKRVFTSASRQQRPTTIAEKSVTAPRPFRKATIPDDDTFVSFMATPKGATPSRVRKTEKYTPYTGKKTFVDTTNLTDREYQLAVEEGLVPGKKRTNLEKHQEKSKKRRDDIIALKRKMNIK